MRNKTLLTLAIAACIASPLTPAQGRGAGAGGPSNVGGMVGGQAGSRMGAMGGQAIDRTSNIPTVDRGSFGRATADRAGTLKDADVATRTGFGTEQSAAAQAQADIGTDTTTDAKLKAKTKTSAKTGSSTRTRTDRDDDADTGTIGSALGHDTAERAKALKDADVDTRKTFGADQSAEVKKSDDDNGG